MDEISAYFNVNPILQICTKIQPWVQMMVRPKRLTLNVSKPQRNNVRNNTRKTRRNDNLENSFSPIRTRSTVVNERKPIPIITVEDSPIVETKPVHRKPRPAIDNNIYIIPDSDDEEVISNINLPEDKRKQIQDYINSITPNRVDYTNKSPLANIVQIKNEELAVSPETTEEEIQKIIKKHAKSLTESPETNVIERIDYKVDLSQQCRTPIKMGIIERCQGSEPIPSTSRAVNIENISTPNAFSNNNSRNNGLNDSDVMEFVDQIVADQEGKISMEIEEHYDRLWSHEEESKRLRLKSEPNNCIDIDSSVVIIESPEPTVTENKPKTPEKVQNVKTENSYEKICPICLDPLSNGKELSATVCGHVFCASCIKTCIQTNHRCPTCRTKLNLKKIIPLFL